MSFSISGINFNIKHASKPSNLTNSHFRGPPVCPYVGWKSFKSHKIENSNEDKRFGKEFLLQNFIIL